MIKLLKWIHQLGYDAGYEQGVKDVAQYGLPQVSYNQRKSAHQ